MAHFKKELGWDDTIRRHKDVDNILKAFNDDWLWQ